MTKDVVAVDADGCGLCTKVDEDTPRAFLVFGKKILAEHQRNKSGVGNAYVSILETVPHSVSQAWIGNYVDIFASDTLSFCSYRVGSKV